MDIEIQNTITLAALIGVAFAMGGVWTDVKSLKKDVSAIKERIFNGTDQRSG